MGIHYNKTKVHWNYFLALEQDFQAISRFIEPCEKNENTFSIELSRIIMSSTQEVDVIIKSLCHLFESSSNPSKINQYFPIIQRHIPQILEEQVYLPRFSMSSQPWIDWKENEAPLWWQANNKIKHQRNTEYHKATLKNAFNSLAALFLTTSYFYKKEFEIENQFPNMKWMDVTKILTPTATLFRLNDSYYYGSVHLGDVQW